MTYEMAVSILMADKVGDRQARLFHRAKRFSYGEPFGRSAWPDKLTDATSSLIFPKNWDSASYRPGISKVDGRWVWHWVEFDG